MDADSPVQGVKIARRNTPNLLAGRIRMLFVADRIPSELPKVVEFLNAQMRPPEVLAVELRRHLGGGLRTLGLCGCSFGFVLLAIGFLTSANGIGCRSVCVGYLAC